MKIEILGRKAVHRAAVVVAQTNAAALSATSLKPPGHAIRVWSPDGSMGSVANAADIAIGYAGLTPANAVDVLKPGDRAEIPCDDLMEVYAVSTAADQTLRVEVL